MLLHFAVTGEVHYWICPHRSDAILHVVGCIRMGWSVGYRHLRVVLGLLVRVGHHDADGCPQSDALRHSRVYLAGV